MSASRPVVMALVRARKASSRPAPVTSMSRAAGSAATSARSVASESSQVRLTVPPVLLDRRDARQPARARRVVHRRSVNRIAGRPTVALISAAGPSATTRPRAIRTIRSAFCVGLLQVVRGEQHRAPSWRARASTPRTRRRLSTSIPTVGSSSTIRPGRDDRHRERHPLPLAAGELTRPGGRRGRDAGQLERLRRRAAGRGCIAAPSATVSRTVRSRSRPPDCSIAPTRPGVIAVAGRRRRRATVPASGRIRPSSSSIVVDLPAPLGPSRATTSPGATVRSIPSTAVTSPNVLRRPVTDTASSAPVTRSEPCPGLTAPGRVRGSAAVRTWPVTDVMQAGRMYQAGP